ncbi:ethylbenzene dehydrogenase-related protein [Desulfonatronum parangueonense]
MKRTPLFSRKNRKEIPYRFMLPALILGTGLVMAASVLVLQSAIAMQSLTLEDNQMPEFNLSLISDPDAVNMINRIQDLEWGEWTRTTAFYPNQISYQWLSGRDGPSGYQAGAAESHSVGANTITDTIACVSCHFERGFDGPWTGRTDLGGNSGYEKANTLELRLRAAYDDQRFYLHVRWKSVTDASGRGLPDSIGPVITHQTYRYDGAGFSNQGKGRMAGPTEIELDHVEHLEPGDRFNYEERLAGMFVPAATNLTDVHGASFNAHGCFMACHDDMRNMPYDLEKVEDYHFADDPVLGKEGMDESDLRHYILRSRAANPDSSPRDRFGTQFAGSPASFEQYLAETVVPDLEAGNFIDLWQARTARSVPMGHASADYVYHYRLHNNQGLDDHDDWAESGTANWFNNRPDPEYADHMPWIYDARITGYWAIHEDNLAEAMRAGHGPLITEGADGNAVHLADDDLFAWDNENKDFRLTQDVEFEGNIIASEGDLLAANLLREGDLVPRRVLREADGARNMVRAFVAWTDQTYDVVLVRDREPSVNGQKTTDHVFDPDSGLTAGFSIFDDHASNRTHYVTFPLGIIGESAGRKAYLDQPDVSPNALVILAKNNGGEASGKTDAEHTKQNPH